MTRVLLFIALLLLPFQSIYAGETGAHWTYEGEQGPEHWGDLSPEYSFCKEGKNQSPVDLVADLHPELPELIFQYHGTPVHETHNGHSIQLKVQPGSSWKFPKEINALRFYRAISIARASILWTVSTSRWKFTWFIPTRTVPWSWSAS